MVLWQLGEHIRPYKNFERFYDDLRTKSDRERYSRAKKIASMLEQIIKQNNNFNFEEVGGSVDISALTLEQSDALFREAYSLLFKQLYPDPKRRSKRPYELMIDTLANRAYSANCKSKNEHSTVQLI